MQRLMVTPSWFVFHSKCSGTQGQSQRNAARIYLNESVIVSSIDFLKTIEKPAKQRERFFLLSSANQLPIIIHCLLTKGEIKSEYYPGGKLDFGTVLLRFRIKYKDEIQ